MMQSNLSAEDSIEAELNWASVEQMRDYNERVTLALDAAEVGLWDWDIAKNQILWSPYLKSLFGYPPEEGYHTYQEWVERVHVDDLESAQIALETAQDTGRNYKDNYRVVLPNNGLRWVRASGRFQYDSMGQPTRMTGMLWDISDQKLIEHRLQESQEKFQATFEQAAVGLAHVGLNGQWLKVNQKLCEILGYSYTELTELTFQDITHPEDLDQDLTCVQQLLRGHIQTYTIEKRYICKDKTWIWVNLTVSLVRQSQNSNEMATPKYFISVIEDICERKAAEQALQKRTHELDELNRLLAQTTALLKQRNQELDEFVYLVSHDLKAPLRAIANLSQWLKDDLIGKLPPENEQQLELMQARVSRMNMLIDGMRNYARVGCTQACVESVDLNSLLSEVINSLSPPPAFTINIAPDLPILRTKRVLLEQIFTNLIGNAIKHHDQLEGRIEISAIRHADCYEFIVADDGPGIPPEQHDRIFGIFQSLDATKPDNTGIGLAIVKKIIESEAGQLFVELNQTTGTTFRFLWPSSQEPR